MELELREGNGEVEAGKRGELPTLIHLKDLRGDLRMHPTATRQYRRKFGELAHAEPSLHAQVAHGDASS